MLPVARRDATTAALKSIGRNIRSFRRAAELTQEQAAAEAGIDYKRWQALEGGRVNATVRTLLRVAAALDVTLPDLVQDD